MTPEQAKILARYAKANRYDPLAFAEHAWPWGIEGGVLATKKIRDWQTWILDDIAQHLMNPETRYDICRIAVASGHGIGKGHSVGMDFTWLKENSSKDTRLFSGKWGDVEVGDYVFGADGAPTKVTATNRYRREHYRVTFDDGSEAVVSGEHEWNVRGRQCRRLKRDGWLTLETQEILARGVQRPNGKATTKKWEIPVQGAAQYDAQEVPIDPYVMGVWLGDGCSMGDGSICKPDDDVRTLCGGRPFHVSGGSFTVPGLGRALKDAKYAPAEGHNKHVPDAYKYNDIATRKAVLAGLLDTDADCCAGYSVEFTNTSEKLCDDVLWLARSLGYKARKSGERPSAYRLADGTRKECKPHWRVRITTHENPFKARTKADRWRAPTQSRYLSRWVESIEPVGVMDGMCITVEAADHLYLTNDFIVTHNSATMGIIATWALACFDRPRILLTANTESQLRTKTSPEIGFWVKQSAFGELFEVDTLSIKLATSPDQHRLDLTPWSVNNTEAFQGLHAAGRAVIVMMDEASAIPKSVWEVILGALTDEDTVLILIAFGNPTQATGEFRNCFTKDRHMWKSYHIDSRNVEGTNKKVLDQIIQKYGVDSDVAKVRVRGLFPSQSTRQFIPEHLVDTAMGKHLPKASYDFAPVILTCDPAWTGEDELVIAKRQGLYFEILETMPRNTNDIEVGRLLANLEVKHNADATFIDLGWGTGIYSYGKTIGRDWRLISFGGKSSKEGFANKRAEMYGDILDWLENGGTLPNDDKLREDLTSIQTKPRPDGTILLMSKEDMKSNQMASPDRGDALALSFAEPVVKRAVPISQTATRYGDPENRDISPRHTQQEVFDPYAGL